MALVRLLGADGGGLPRGFMSSSHIINLPSSLVSEVVGSRAMMLLLRGDGSGLQLDGCMKTATTNRSSSSAMAGEKRRLLNRYRPQLANGANGYQMCRGCRLRVRGMVLRWRW